MIGVDLSDGKVLTKLLRFSKPSPQMVSIRKASTSPLHGGPGPYGNPVASILASWCLPGPVRQFLDSWRLLGQILTHAKSFAQAFGSKNGKYFKTTFKKAIKNH